MKGVAKMALFLYKVDVILLTTKKGEERHATGIQFTSSFTVEKDGSFIIKV